MADTLPVVPPLPPPGEIVTSAALYATQIALYRNTAAFGGSRNPSSIWSSMQRDDGSAFIYYRELEAKDTDVANALDTLKLSVLERPNQVTPADDSDQAAEVAAFVQGQLDRIPNWHGVLDNLLDAPGYGFALGEMVFDTSMGQASLVDIKDCPQELFLFGNRYQPQIGPLQFLTSPYASDGQRVPENKFLIFTYRSRSRNRMGRPLLRDIFWPSWIKRNIQQLWLQYAEKGPGTAVVRYSDADNQHQKQQAADLAQALMEQVAVAVPIGFEYDKDLLALTRTLNPDVYEHFYQTMQLDIVRRVMGETLTSFGGENGKGTQALGSVHSDTLDKRSIGLCRALAAAVNTQVIAPLVLWNFGPGAPMPTWRYETEQKEDLVARMNIDSKLFDMGLAIPVSYLRDRYEMPAPEDGEDVLVKAAQATPSPVLPDPDDTSFSEGAAGGIAGRRARQDLQAHMEMRQFDELTRQLQDESLGLIKQRVTEIADAVAPGR